MSPARPPHPSIGQAVRSHRVAVRSRVRAPRDRVASLAVIADVLEGGHPYLDRLRIWDVLEWGWRIETRHIMRVLGHADVRNHYRRVGELPPRQLEAICTALRDPQLVFDVRRQEVSAA